MKRNFFAMNTYISFTVYGDALDKLMDISEAKVRELEDLWSVTKEHSEVYTINNANGKPVLVSDETADLLRFSLRIGKQTEGALDITLYPVLKTWGFTTGSYQIPSEQLLLKKMQYVGLEKVAIRDRLVSLQPGMQIDFGAVAKGYTCDVIRKILKRNGVTSAIISLGGNVCAIGSKPDGSDFKIAVQYPNSCNSVGILFLSDICISTSGSYERYFIGRDEKKYGHILNPKTGKPKESDLISVTVVGKEGKMCDAISTALFVKGLVGAIEYYKKNTDIELLLIIETGEVYISEVLSKRFIISDEYKNIPIKIITR